jgi:hypothetical protein
VSSFEPGLLTSAKAGVVKPWVPAPMELKKYHDPIIHNAAAETTANPVSTLFMLSLLMICWSIEEQIQKVWVKVELILVNTGKVL